MPTISSSSADLRVVSGAHPSASPPSQAGAQQQAARQQTGTAQQTGAMQQAGAPKQPPPRPAGHAPWLPIILGVLFPIALIALWQAVYTAQIVSPLVIPRPLDVVDALIKGVGGGTWWRHIGATAQATVLAFAGGFVTAIVIGSIFAFSALARQTFYPYIIAIQSFPKVAVAPLLVVWLGYGLMPKVVIGGLLAFFPIFTNTVAGLTEIDRDETDLFRSLRASKLDQLRFLRIPNALSYIFPALNVAAVNALLGVIVGELVGTDAGLGYLISQRSFLGDTAGVFGVLFLLALIGVSMFLLLKLIERYTRFSR
ncbi:MAG: ABC transporter permease [Burkholderiales bacterium]|nr:ABC transporter permease [Burkholderiales bacterium]